LALATLVAMAVARALGGARIMVAQAASSAILVVVVADGEGGVYRLLDAMIGAGVALVFSQLLFSPDPVALLRRGEAAALSGMAEGLELTARALESDEDKLAEKAMTKLRDVRDDLAELGRMRKASTRVVRHSLVWRSQMGPVVREKENAGHLDLLGVSCLMLTRTATAVNPSHPQTLISTVQELSDAIANLAKEPGNRSTRQHAAERALEIVKGVSGGIDQPNSTLISGVMAVRQVAYDLMVFAGVDAHLALRAMKEGTGELPVVQPPPTIDTPFPLKRRRGG